MIIRSWKNFGTPGEREREREEKETHIVTETKQQFLAMSPLRAHLSWNHFRWDIFTMSNCWLSLGVPKGSRTVNWVGESPDYIPCKHETNRDTFDDRPHRDIFPFIGHKSNNAILYDTHADTEVRQNDTNA
ncbi:hypothetical protein ALC53_07146 [Atta colombica]|uniref:Uncharacterized protein n=1 Tax=Atta colombica TaxID=520822 RepID=A0A195BCS3_9HYME|nr:hypothetical protein ALC53_07146 [Atta colombica]